MSRESDEAAVRRMIRGEPNPMFTVGAVLRSQEPWSEEAKAAISSYVDCPMSTYRVYADGNVVHEDDFNEYDNSLPYYDDYGEYEIPDAIIDHIVQEWT